MGSGLSVMDYGFMVQSSGFRVPEKMLKNCNDNFLPFRYVIEDLRPMAFGFDI
jgi:hypothetical protein